MPTGLACMAAECAFAVWLNAWHRKRPDKDIGEADEWPRCVVWPKK